MIEYTELDASYKTVKVSAMEPENDGSIDQTDPTVTAPSTFIFSGLGADANERAKLVLQVGEFASVGFAGVPPESVLLALLEHFKGLQVSNLKCNEFRFTIDALTDSLSALKARNDLRDYKGTYGTNKP